MIPLEHKERMEEISRTLMSWEDTAIAAINANESFPRTRLRLLRALATPYNPDSSASTANSSDVYHNEMGVTWEDYEKRTREAFAKAEAQKKARQERRDRENAQRASRSSRFGSRSTNIMGLDNEMDLDDEEVQKAGSRQLSGQKRKAGGGRKGGGTISSSGSRRN
ncbi:MAG: hypothetical protein LQ340_004024 [Diploschistes diacapsis]|nr:MAG: hypothetical protein LQ340_004024 [Diploschistes diacapsis]